MSLLACLALTVLAPAVPWVRPTATAREPRWGLRDGLQVGLWPTPGPRGLLRVYTPYLGQPAGRMLNFLAIEPLVGGARGYSELERSALDDSTGLRLWSADSLEQAVAPGDVARPAAGVVTAVEDHEELSVALGVERFAHGAAPLLVLAFRSDRPHEVAIAVSAAPASAVMSACIITATMGNYARLRRLQLADEVVRAETLWRPEATGDGWHFLPPRLWPAPRLPQLDGQAVLTCWSDEADPAAATYDPQVPVGWRYVGRPARQTWRAAVVPGLVARVNGRRRYWACEQPIPGGVAFENVELEAPFVAGQRWVYAVEPQESPPAG